MPDFPAIFKKDDDNRFESNLQYIYDETNQQYRVVTSIDLTSNNAQAISITSTLLGANGTFTILAGKTYAVAFLTGTGTFNGAAIPSEFSRDGKTSVNIIVTTDVASSCYIDISN